MVSPYMVSKYGVEGFSDGLRYKLCVYRSILLKRSVFK